jgi:hypothetical protein
LNLARELGAKMAMIVKRRGDIESSRIVILDARYA